MEHSLLRPKDRIETVIHMYGDQLFRFCLVMLKNTSDAEDAVQEVFMKYLRKAPEFADTEHEKAWLLTVAGNQCKDMLRHRTRHSVVDLTEIRECCEEMPDSGIFEALLQVPDKYRLVLILYYVEEYRTEDIARMIGKTKSAVKMRLQKGRMLLEKVYRKEFM